MNLEIIKYYNDLDLQRIVAPKEVIFVEDLVKARNMIALGVAKEAKPEEKTSKRDNKKQENNEE